jgi:hypothetical protein
MVLEEVHVLVNENQNQDLQELVFLNELVALGNEVEEEDQFVERNVRRVQVEDLAEVHETVEVDEVLGSPLGYFRWGLTLRPSYTQFVGVSSAMGEVLEQLRRVHEERLQVSVEVLHAQ